MAEYLRKSKVSSKKDTKKGLQKGVDMITEIVCSTLGGSGRPVVISRENGLPPVVTKDGVTVARLMHFPDGKISTLSARLIVDASLKTNAEAGDGTTTTVALVSSILKAVKKIEKEHNVKFRKTDFDNTVSMVNILLRNASKKIETSDDIFNIAKVSSNDDGIARRIKEAYDLVGHNGLVDTKISLNDREEIIFKKGIELDKGFINPLFGMNQQKVEIVAPILLVIKGHLSSFQTIQEVIINANLANRDVIIFAVDFAKETIIEPLIKSMYAEGENKQLNINVQLLTGMSFGKRQLDILDDIATIFNVTPFDSILSNEINLKKHTVELSEDYSFIISNNKTIINLPEDWSSSDNKRVTELELKLKEETSFHEIEKLEERLSILKGCKATITYHANSEAESDEIRDRIDDALNSVKASISEGYILGGSCALDYIVKTAYVKSREEIIDLVCSDEDVTDGYFELLLETFKNIHSLLLSNTDKISFMDDLYERRSAIENITDVIINSTPEENLLYNVRTEKFENGFDSGIIDATKVFRTAFENAMSVASVIHLSGYSVYQEVMK